VELLEEEVEAGGVALRLLRPPDAEALIDEDAFARNEFLPYWAELWPAGLALAAALPASLRGLRVVELGCGLGLPSLAAAARGAEVVATDWSEDAIELLRLNAERNGIRLRAEVADWAGWNLDGPWDLVLSADVLYEHRNVPLLLDLLPRLGAVALVAEPGRPPSQAFFREARERWQVEELGDRVYRITTRPSAPSSRAVRAGPA
jgi:predicted nicotinamide N-methyase